MRNKLQVSSRVHRGRRKLPTESRQVLPGLSPNWGFTSMTPGKARGKKHKVSREPQSGRYKLRPPQSYGAGSYGALGHLRILNPRFHRG